MIWRKADQFLHVCVCGISESVWEGWKFCSTYSSTYVNFPIENFWPLRKSHHEQLENWISISLSRYDEKSLTPAKFSIFSSLFHVHSVHSRVLEVYSELFLYFLIIALAHFTNFFQCAAIKNCNKIFQYFFKRGRMWIVSLNLDRHTPHCLITFFSLFLIYSVYFIDNRASLSRNPNEITCRSVWMFYAVLCAWCWLSLSISLKKFYLCLFHTAYLHGMTTNADFRMRYKII